MTSSPDDRCPHPRLRVPPALDVLASPQLMLSYHLRRPREIVALGDDLARAMVGHAQDRAMSIMRR